VLSGTLTLIVWLFPSMLSMASMISISHSRCPRNENQFSSASFVSNEVTSVDIGLKGI
jgi:hypothetical protein